MIRPPSHRRAALDAIVTIALFTLARRLWPDAAAHQAPAVAFLGFLIPIVIGIFEHIASAAVTVAVTIAQAAVMIGTALVHFGLQVAAVFGKVYGFLSRFWTGVLRPFVQAVWKDLKTAYQWSKRWADRAIHAIEKIRARVMAIYEHWFRPIFDVIEATRLTLKLLAALRIEWAAALERRLADLEDKLLYPIREVMFRLNQAIDWINRIITFDGYLQRITLIGSLIRHALESWAVLLGPQLRGLDAGQIAAMHARDYPGITADELAQQMMEFAAAGAGPIAPLAGKAAAALPTSAHGS